MTLEEASLEELTAELDRLDAERVRLKERARAVKLALQAALEEDNARQHGLTVEVYQAVKQAAREAGVDFPRALGKVRKAARSVQVAKATPAEIAAHLKGL